MTGNVIISKKTRMRCLISYSYEYFQHLGEEQHRLRRTHVVLLGSLDLVTILINLRSVTLEIQNSTPLTDCVRNDYAGRVFTAI